MNNGKSNKEHQVCAKPEQTGEQHPIHLFHRIGSRIECSDPELADEVFLPIERFLRHVYEVEFIEQTGLSISNEKCEGMLCCRFWKA